MKTTANKTDQVLLDELREAIERFNCSRDPNERAAFHAEIAGLRERVRAAGGTLWEVFDAA